MAASISAPKTWSLPTWVPRRRRLRPVATTPNAAFHRALPWLLVGLMMALIPLFGQVPTWALLVFGACMVWRYWLEAVGRPLPSLLARLLVFAPVGYLILNTYGSAPSATGMLAFLIALLSLKVLELRGPRDFTIAALLGFFMLLAALFYEQSLGLSAYLGLVVLVLVVALIYCHGAMRTAWPTVRLALGMSVQALPLVVLLFVVFPRVQGSFLHRIGGGTSGKMGMSDRLQPGSFSALAQSNDPAFRATLDQAGTPTVNQNQLYWRGAVLDFCEQPLVWKTGPRQAVSLPSKSAGVRQTITLFSNDQSWLFALDRPSGYETKYASSPRADFLRNETLRARAPVYRTATYTVYSNLEARDDTPLLEGERRRYLSLPPDIGKRSHELTTNWRKNARNDEDVLRVAGQFFGTNNFVYTLSPGLLPTKDSLDYFLFESRRGFCEHYAAAYCTLMRDAGIPARVVVGYQGGEYNHWGVGHYLVRQSDAHAWAEVWLPGRGWLRRDPTGLVAPERVSYGAENYASMDGSLSEKLRLERLVQMNAPGSLRWVLRNASQMWDSVDEQWNQFVLGFNQDTQLTLLEKLGLDKLDLVKGTLLTVVVAFALLAAGGAVVYLLERGLGQKGDPVQRLYARFCRELARRAGLTRLVAEGPLDFARRASQALPEQAGDIHRITDLYVSSRYARDGGQGVVAALRAAVGKFRVTPAKE